MIINPQIPSYISPLSVFIPRLTYLLLYGRVNILDEIHGAASGHGHAVRRYRKPCQGRGTWIGRVHVADLQGVEGVSASQRASRAPTPVDLSIATSFSFPFLPASDVPWKVARRSERSIVVSKEPLQADACVCSSARPEDQRAEPIEVIVSGRHAGALSRFTWCSTVRQQIIYFAPSCARL